MSAVRFAARSLSAPGFALNPYISGPLLLALLTAPETIRKLLEERLHISAGPQRLATAKKVLQVLLAIGGVKYVNGLLSRMATNSGRIGPAKGWMWPHEVAVVTGGCSGIGYDVVKRLAKKNIKIAVLDVQAPPRDFEQHRNIHYYKCDVTSPEQVAASAQSIREVLGQPSILINNAGIALPSAILETSQSDLQRIFAINTMSHWTTVKEFLPGMIRNDKGHVVTVASLASFATLPRMTDYAATKASAMAFHEGLALELRRLYKTKGVLTSIVHPDFARTALGDAVHEQVAKTGTAMLTPEYVAGEIAAAVFARRSSNVIVPRQAGLVASLRAWPLWMQAAFLGSVGKTSEKLQV